MNTTAPTRRRPPRPSCGCPDFSLSRRSLLKAHGRVGGGMADDPDVRRSHDAGLLRRATGGNTMVVISLRGGIDGMGVVVPYGDPGYYTARPHTAVPARPADLHRRHVRPAPQDGAPAEVLELQGACRHPGCRPARGQPLALLGHRGGRGRRPRLLAAHAAGSTGWSELASTSGTHSNPRCLDAVQLGMNFPTTALGGDAPTLATTDLSGLQVSGLDADYVNQRYASLATAWSGATGPLADGHAQAVAISKGPGKSLKAMPDNPYVTYPTVWNAAPFAAPLKSAAKLIRANLGTDVIAIDAGNWDLHTNYGNLSGGIMQSNIDGLAQALAAFLDDLGTDCASESPW